MAEGSPKAIALAVIGAVESGDTDKFNQAFSSVDEESASLLEKFLVEVATDKYEIFSKAEAPSISANPNYARSILRAWRRVGSARKYMAARMAFETALILTRRNK